MQPGVKKLPGAAARADVAGAAPELSEPRGRRRRPLRALLVGSVLALLLGEGLCRWRFGAPLAEREPLMEVRANTARGFEMVPSTVHYTYQHEARINSLGLRGPEPVLEPDREHWAPVVLCLGDSMVYGQGVAEEDTLPAAIERRLRSHGRAAQVLNAGVRSYDTLQELAFLEELLPRVHPSVVVLFWFANDLEEADLAAWSSSLERSGPVVFDVRGRMEGALRRKWQLVQLARSSALVMKLHDAWRAAKYQPVPATDVEAQFQLLDGKLARFARLSREHGFEALVAVIPLNDIVEHPEADDSVATRVLALAQTHALPGTALLEPLRALRAAAGHPCTLAYDGHYDGRANAAMGEKVADELEQRFSRRLAVREPGAASGR